MNALPLSSAVARAVTIEWWQAGEVHPIDCAGFTCEVGETTLPFTPTIVPVSLGLGRFQMQPFTAQQRALLKPGRQYGLQLLLRAAAGDAIEELRLSIEIS